MLTFTNPNTSAQVANSEVSSLGSAAWQEEERPVRAEVSMLTVTRWLADSRE